MREYIRHPTDIPIEYNLSDHIDGRKKQLKNISAGGLCFRTDDAIEPGTALHIVIPVCEPVFEADAEVVWCHRVKNYYHVGVKFADKDTAFAVRMVEQVCHIEHYRRNVADKEGRHLTAEKAAMEWIGKYAKDFPR